MIESPQAIPRPSSETGKRLRARLVALGILVRRDRDRLFEPRSIHRLPCLALDGAGRAASDAEILEARGCCRGGSSDR